MSLVFSSSSEQDRVALVAGQETAGCSKRARNVPFCALDGFNEIRLTALE
jgi:hypothetical protein